MKEQPAAYTPEIGDVVAVRTADDRWLRKVVVGVGGYDFPCWHLVWEGDFASAWSPWPVEDVRPLSEHPDALTKEAFSVRA